jgi:predicted enzyme related to lactoylglutathione lyase
MAELGAPAGFEDVVAALATTQSGQADERPRWSVTFGVEEVEATAALAEELGGSVLVAPFDAPWARTAVIADPQGATFIATQFVLENRDVAAAPRRSAHAA